MNAPDLHAGATLIHTNRLAWDCGLAENPTLLVDWLRVHGYLAGRRRALRLTDRAREIGAVAVPGEHGYRFIWPSQMVAIYRSNTDGRTFVGPPLPAACVCRMNEHGQHWCDRGVGCRQLRPAVVAPRVHRPRPALPPSDAVDGSRLRAARVQRGLTIHELAASAHIHPRALARWEQGAYSLSAVMRERLARALNVPAFEFLASNANAGSRRD